MGNINKFINESQRYFEKRGWISMTLFQNLNRNNKLILYLSYFQTNMNTYTTFNYKTLNKKDTYITTKHIFEHISHLWRKYDIGEQTISVFTNAHFDIKITKEGNVIPPENL